MNKLAKHVDSEVFWRNSCVTKWNILTLPPEHVTWKAAFFSNYLQNFIENMEVS
jgi:hypothetical protein